jgi:amidase
MPAAFCGIYGIRPSHGRVNLTGAMAMAPSFDVGGWFANGPGVFRRLGDVLLDPARVPARIERLIILDDAFEQADTEVATLLQSALRDMGGDLPKPERSRIAPGGLDVWRETFRLVQAGEVWQSFGEFVERQRPRLGPGIRERMEFAARVPHRDVAQARQEHTRARDHIRTIAAPGTILALPTSPCVSPLLSSPAEELETFRTRAVRLTCIAGLGGLPQVNLPIGAISGAPIGLSFIAWPGGDEDLLALCTGLSRYCGYAM